MSRYLHESNRLPSEGVALITGGAKRIGRSIALALAGKGYDIALHYHSSRGEAEQTGREIEQTGRRCHLFPCDFNHRNGPISLMAQVFETFPDCNLLINNASVFKGGRLMETDEKFFDLLFNVNFKTPVLLSRDFASRCQNGQIVNLLDSRTAQTDTDHFVYTLTRKALLEFTRLAAKEMAPHIRVNAVCPGIILPPAGKDEKYLEEKSATLPLRRKGSPESLLSAILFLIDNPFITGESLFIDGGAHLG